jgi:hypothetical protein
VAGDTFLPRLARVGRDGIRLPGHSGDQQQTQQFDASKTESGTPVHVRPRSSRRGDPTRTCIPIEFSRDIIVATARL